MSKTPPKVAGLPILGSILGLAKSPNNFMLNLVRQYGDVANFKLMNLNAYMVADPEAIQDIFIRKKDKFIKAERSRKVMAGMLGDSLLVSVGDYHAQQRKMVQPAFHATRIHNYADTMVDYTERHLAQWQNQEVRDIHHDMMILTMEIVSKTLFGSDVANDALRVGEAIALLQSIANKRFVNPLAGLLIKYTKLGEQGRAAGQTINDVVMRFITERREAGTPDTGDLLSMLLLSTNEDGQPMSDKEARDEAVTLFSAGHETTSNALTWTLFLLSQNPTAREKLHAEVDTVLAGCSPTLADLKNLPYTQMVIKESMRLYPPVWILMARTALENVEVGGYQITEGANVMISPYATHRNPRLWDAPDEFRPERFSPENEKKLHRYQYFPFGGGEHICIGNMFAMMEAQLVLVTIASRYDLSLATSPTDVKEQALVTLFPRDGLPMRVTQREVIHNETLAVP